ncbi:unnamed protein product [Pleuronectes platessa]|uniref:Uncharacterized protein n=1 Tax=Pleuronectes platessa TaxID=8262 RepID=A0A9N7TTC5_PLEPL|nr:unnamed protein product [Pleuronectes platessa]
MQTACSEFQSAAEVVVSSDSHTAALNKSEGRVRSQRDGFVSVLFEKTHISRGGAQGLSGGTEQASFEVPPGEMSIVAWVSPLSYFSPSLGSSSSSLSEWWGRAIDVFASQEAAQTRTTGLASPVVSVEIKRTATEAQRTLMLPRSR